MFWIKSQERPRRHSRAWAGIIALLVMLGALTTVGLTAGSASAGRVVKGSTRCTGTEGHICAYLYTFRPCGHCKREIRAQGYIKDYRGGTNYDVLVDQVILYRKTYRGGHARWVAWRAVNPKDAWVDQGETVWTNGTRYHGEYKARVRAAWQVHNTSHHIYTTWLWSHTKYFGG